MSIGEFEALIEGMWVTVKSVLTTAALISIVMVNMT